MPLALSVKTDLPKKKHSVLFNIKYLVKAKHVMYKNPVSEILRSKIGEGALVNEFCFSYSGTRLTTSSYSNETV